MIPALILLALAPPLTAQPMRPVRKAPDAATMIRTTPDPKAADARIVPSPKPERQKLTTDQARSVRQAAAKAARDVKVAKCKAANGAWSAEVRGVELFGKGSDVDEIYGHIYATASDGGTYDPSSRSPGWNHNDLWSTNDKNIDLGGDRQTRFPRMTIRNLQGAQRHEAKIYIHLDLHDEDDGRGGCNDESFMLDGALGPYDNYRRFEFYVPPCAQNPEFEKTWRQTISARDDGRGGSNMVFLDVKIHVRRLYP